MQGGKYLSYQHKKMCYITLSLSLSTLNVLGMLEEERFLLRNCD